MSEQAWLEPIRTAAAVVAADPPPLTKWETGHDEGQVACGEVDQLLCELGWPSRTKTFKAPVGVFTPERPRVLHEFTETLFPVSWLNALTEDVSKYVLARDAGQHPEVPDGLRLRKLPHTADFDTLRDLIEGAWDDAWDELACSVAIMCPYDGISMDGLRYNLALSLWYGPYDPWAHSGFEPAEGVCPLRTRRKGTYAERLGEEEADSFPDLRNLPSPKWRAWYLDTWNDRIAINDALDCCGVEVTEQLDIDLERARYTFDTDIPHMTIEELVTRLEARHRFFASAFRAARDNPIRDEPSGDSNRAGFNPRQHSNRPPQWGAIMEMVVRLKCENVRWKEIKEQVEAAHRYRFDSDEALRKSFERWQKGRTTSG